MFNCACIQKLIHKVSAFFIPIWDLTARLVMAELFWKSGLTKIDDWEATLWLYKHEYDIDFLTTLSAYVSTGIELGAPVMLVLGLGTRFAAASLFVLSIVIHMTYPNFHEHYFWMLVCAAIALRGASTISLDHWLCKKYGCNA